MPERWDHSLSTRRRRWSGIWNRLPSLSRWTVPLHGFTRHSDRGAAARGSQRALSRAVRAGGAAAPDGSSEAGLLSRRALVRRGAPSEVRSSFLAVATVLGLAVCTPAVRQPLSPADYPRTRPEQTRYRETSHYADVRKFLDSLRALRAPLVFGSIGKTNEGRDIPYVIASRPLVSTPSEAKRLGRPIVYVQGNIHAGEVEGKDALLALLRDLSFSSKPNVLDSIVLIAVPIYNADGNERFAAQSVNRTEQNGPELVGVRSNAQNLDLNRDYVKAEAPETRASLAMFNTWDPDVFVDLHTTDGSFHGYALTYSPSLSPAEVFGGVSARDSLLPVLRVRMRTRHGFEVFDYGNFISDEPGARTDTSVREGWATYDARPRFGTNYYGIRGRIGILSEAYSVSYTHLRAHETRHD